MINSLSKRSTLFVLLISLSLFSACAPIRATRWWQPDLADSSKFRNARILPAKEPFRFIAGANQIQHQQLKIYLDTFLNRTNTNAFLIIKNDTIIYERFAENVNQNTLHPSFSVAKSFVATLMGISIDKGIIHSSNDLVIKYLPTLEKNDERFKKLTIQHVLDMRSAIDYDENKETPFSAITKLYYGSSLNNQIANLKMKGEPGLKFEYQSVNTQILSAILEKASGRQIQDLLAEYLWQPLGAESNALWSLDNQKTAKAFCCFNATAIDFAKLGRLYLKNGNWDGNQIISKRWMDTTTNPDTLDQLGYKNQWWACYDFRYFKDLESANAALAKLKISADIKKTKYNGYYFKVKANDYTAEGILGQFVYVNPKNKVIIVRMGNYPNRQINFENFIPKIGRQL
ncbi:class C beta-lactamase-related serine hydrolase [Pedobacter frigidisoli]|uniref:Class C beta-lactamase-related serine hydrolase n=1 Tax=Pedobacter frigidisoli TaxID=2530455 RepID=A0A4R0P5V1_9SPHI|nr:serine hydrolase [Pedobacter frigidisoli]TCD11226.1 class C beta-lactamase-related serine hydrolase [Pedobacter frigidisoli]